MITSGGGDRGSGGSGGPMLAFVPLLVVPVVLVVLLLLLLAQDRKLKLNLVVVPSSKVKSLSIWLVECWTGGKVL